MRLTSDCVAAHVGGADPEWSLAGIVKRRLQRGVAKLVLQWRRPGAAEPGASAPAAASAAGGRSAAGSMSEAPPAGELGAVLETEEDEDFVQARLPELLAAWRSAPKPQRKRKKAGSAAPSKSSAAGDAVAPARSIAAASPSRRRALPAAKAAVAPAPAAVAAAAATADVDVDLTLVEEEEVIDLTCVDVPFSQETCVAASACSDSLC